MKKTTYHLNSLNTANGGSLNKSSCPCPDYANATRRLARILSKSFSMSYLDDIGGIHLRTDIWEYAYGLIGSKESVGVVLLNQLRKTSRVLASKAVVL